MKKVTVNGNDHELSPDSPRSRSHVELLQDMVTSINNLETGTSPDGLELTSTDAAVNVITSASNDATTSSTVAALTFKNTVAHTANDLEYNFKRSDDTSLLKIDKEGDVTIAGGFTCTTVTASGALSAAGISTSGATTALTSTSANVITSATSDANTTDSIAALTLKASAVLTGTDLVLAVQNSANTNLLKVTYDGVLTTNSHIVSSGSVTAAGAGGLNTDKITSYNGTGVTLSEAVGTAGSGTAVRSAKICNVVHRVTFGHDDLTDADTSQALTIWTVPAKTRIIRIVADVTTPFTGGGVTACTLQVGISGGDTDAYLSAFDCFAGATTKGLIEADLGVALVNSGSGVGAFPDFTTTKAIAAQFDSTTANVADLTAGSVTFYIECVSY